MCELISKHLKALFAIFVVLGVAVILGFTILQGPQSGRLPGEPSRHWVMIGIVVALMLVYGGAVWVRSKTHYATEGDGETFYYLGFIFTLATLVATFAPLLGTETKPESKVVLGLFGLGLITTFVGLAGRIFFFQLAGDQPDSADERARRLSSAYVEAARAIEASTLQITKAHSHAEERLKDAYSATVKAIGTVAAQATQEYSRVTSDAGRQLTNMIGDASHRAESVLKELEARVVGLRLPPSELGEQLGEALHDLVQRSQKLGQAIQSMEGAFAALERGISTALKSVSEGATALNGLGGAAGAASVSSSRATESIETLSVSVDALRKTVGEAEAACKNLAGNAELASHSAASTATAVGNLANSVRSAGQAATKMGGSLQTLSDRSNTLAEMAARGVKLAQGIVDTQGRLSEQISSELAELIRQYNDAVRTVGKTLQEDLKASEDAVRRVHQNLIEASRFIITQVK